MQNSLGYNKKLFILPFDHRSSFAKMFGFVNLSKEEKDYIAFAKQIIYSAFKKAVSETVPKKQAAILVDEEYGATILRDAISQGFITILNTEKSGNPTFDFEYEEEFVSHIEKYKPTFVKALIRYKPHADWAKIKMLSDYCH